MLINVKVQKEPIPKELYSQFLSNMPQVSIEIFLEHEKEVLLAKRNNNPAKGKWFWPGGRLYKGEDFEEAVKRISKEELNVEVKMIGLLGVYNHFWETGKYNNSTTHTVNIVFHVNLLNNRSEIKLDEQHDDYIFTSKIRPKFHRYVKKYLRDSKLDLEE